MGEASVDSSENIDQKAETVVIGGRYELGKLVGRGAFAKVYRARDQCTSQIVAIKCVNRHLIVENGLMERIKREISIMRRVRHANVIELYEVIATKTKIYLVMELARGGELFDRVTKGRFSEDLSRRVFRQLISAVGFCHARGVFHRDLKLENLLLDSSGNLKVSDFGLSAMIQQSDRDGLLHTQCGTPAYVAPEILSSSGYDGAKVDVWSCGVILFVLMAGYLPFNDRNLMVMYRKIWEGNFRFPKWTSPELRRLILRLLDPNPATRITVEEIIHDPWFNHGSDGLIEVISEKSKVQIERCLNAFDIINFASGLDLSAMFGEAEDELVERFVSDKSVKEISEVVEAAAIAAGMAAEKSDFGMKVKGPNGNASIVIEMNWLTEDLLVVEVTQRKDTEDACRKAWEREIRPKLVGLIYEPMIRGSGEPD